MRVRDGVTSFARLELAMEAGNDSARETGAEGQCR